MPSSTPNEVFSTCERRKDCVLPDGHGGKCECAKEGDFIVESILDEKIARGKRKFLIKWKGWSKEHDTWEPIENLTGCPDILKRWLATHPSPSAPSPVPLSAGQTVLHASPKSLGANMTKASSTPKAAGTHHASESSFVPLQGGEVSAAVKKRRLEANSNNEQAMPKFKTPPATAAAKKWPSEANSASAGQPAPQQPAKSPLKSSTPASAKQRAKLQANPQAKQPGKPQVQELAKSIAKTSSKSASKPASKPKDGLAGKQRKLAGKPSSKASSTSTIGPAAEKGNQPVEKLATKPDVHSDQASATQRDLSPATKQASKQTSKPVAKPEKGQGGPPAATLSSSKPALNAAIATKAAAKTEKIAAKPTGHGTSSQTQGTPCWLFQGTRLRTSHDGTGSLQKAKGYGVAAAVGSTKLTHGRHALTFNIVSTNGAAGGSTSPAESRKHRNFRGCMMLGVTDATVDVAQTKGGTSWGFNPYSGKLFVSDRIDDWGASRQVVQKRREGADADAIVKSVRIEADLSMRKLSFSVDGAAPVAVDSEGAAALRPWCILFSEGDRIELQTQTLPQNGSHAAAPAAAHERV